MNFATGDTPPGSGLLPGGSHDGYARQSQVIGGNEIAMNYLPITHVVLL